MPKYTGQHTRRNRSIEVLSASVPIAALPSVASKASQALDAYRGNASPELRTELAEAVLTLHAHGQPLVDACRTIARESGHPVSPGMLRSWCADSDRLGPMLIRARELCAEALAESTLAIADEGEDVGRDKLRIDVRRSLAGQYDAARWGQRAAPAVGAVAQASVTVQVGGDLAAVLAAAGATITQK
jgi:hypothetical protein